ncbi:MAG: sigma-70 family RNA polymerase sigma factor [Calditrichaeota bacterium]|nr:sigma-70 family RNA polymerase sigma factor [Calditrichota bacterium]
MIASKQSNNSEARILWEKMRGGDGQALADLFRNYYAFLYDYGMKLCSRAELVKDSIQEVFAYLWKKHTTISRVDSVSAYLLASLRRQLLKSIERQNLRQEVYHEFCQNLPTQAFSAEELLIMNEEMDSANKILQQALNKIPTRMREALYLKTNQKLSYKEIAAIMKINSQVARNYVSEAFRRLRTTLNEVNTSF